MKFALLGLFEDLLQIKTRNLGAESLKVQALINRKVRLLCQQNFVAWNKQIFKGHTRNMGGGSKFKMSYVGFNWQKCEFWGSYSKDLGYCRRRNINET